MTGDWTTWSGERFSLGGGLRPVGERLVVTASTVALPSQDSGHGRRAVSHPARTGG